MDSPYALNEVLVRLGHPSSQSEFKKMVRIDLLVNTIILWAFANPELVKKHRPKLSDEFRKDATQRWSQRGSVYLESSMEDLFLELKLLVTGQERHPNTSRITYFHPNPLVWLEDERYVAIRLDETYNAAQMAEVDWEMPAAEDGNFLFREWFFAEKKEDGSIECKDVDFTRIAFNHNSGEFVTHDGLTFTPSDPNWLAALLNMNGYNAAGARLRKLLSGSELELLGELSPTLYNLIRDQLEQIQNDLALGVGSRE